MDNKFDEVVLECSPFIRTIQTAAIIAKVIGHKNIRVQYKYTECLHPAFYEENPVPLLYVRNRKPEEISRDFLEGMPFEHSDEAGYALANKIFPENDTMENVERMKPTCHSFLKMYEGSKKRVLHLVATHAAIVKSLAVIFGGELQHGLCQYCAISGVEIDGPNWRLIYAEDDSHIPNAKL